MEQNLWCGMEWKGRWTHNSFVCKNTFRHTVNKITEEDKQETVIQYTILHVHDSGREKRNAKDTLMSFFHP